MNAVALPQASNPRSGGLAHFRGLLCAEQILTVQLFSREQAGVGMNVHCLTVSLSNARFQELSELHGCVETNRTSGWHSIALGLVLWANSMSPRQSLSRGLTPGPLPTAHRCYLPLTLIC